MHPRNEIRHNPDGTIDIVLERGSYVRIKAADYAKVAPFYWFGWQAATGVEYAAASVLVDGELMFVVMPEVIAAADDRFAGITPTRPSGDGELHLGIFDVDEEAARTYARAAQCYFGADPGTNASVGWLPPEEAPGDDVVAGQVITPTA